MAKQVHLRNRHSQPRKTKTRAPVVTTKPLSSGLLTYKAAAQFLGVSQGTLENWICSGLYDVPHFRVGRLVRFRLASLARWLDSRERGGPQVVSASQGLEAR